MLSTQNKTKKQPAPEPAINLDGSSNQVQPISRENYQLLDYGLSPPGSNGQIKNPQ